jgi:hypothetical protein
MRLVFEAIRHNRSPAAADGVPNVDPANIKLGVYNGTRTSGVASAAATSLRAAASSASGTVDVTDIADAKRHTHRTTTVVYSPDRPGAFAKAQYVAAAIPNAVVHAGPTKPNVDVAVIVGTRFSTKKIVSIRPLPLPQPGALPAVCRQ